MNSVNKIMVREKSKNKLIEAVARELVTFWDYRSSVVVDESLNVITSVNFNGEICECASTAMRKRSAEICSCSDGVTIAVPVCGENMHGAILLQTQRKPDAEEIELLETLASDLALALDYIDAEKQRNRVYSQINRNIQQLAEVVDRIRNPIAIIAGIAETKIDDGNVVREILEQVERIDKLVDDIERCWIKSEELAESLRNGRV